MGYAETVWIRLVPVLHEKAHDEGSPSDYRAVTTKELQKPSLCDSEKSLPSIAEVAYNFGLCALISCGRCRRPPLLRPISLGCHGIWAICSVCRWGGG
jgi:hypothetical protein